jgi:hypothetical protein
VVDVDGIFALHCEFVCLAHRRNADGSFSDPVAHAACPIHTVLALASGAWVPWRSPEAAPRVQQRAPRVHIRADTPEGAFVTSHLADGLARGFWERVADPADFAQCAIIEAGFVASSLKPQSLSGHGDDAGVDVPAIDATARRRASEFVSEIAALRARGSLTKAAFLRRWAAITGGLPKYRFCVGHDFFLNRACSGWSLQFPSAHSMLESAVPGDCFMVRDHVSGYSSIPIRSDMRRFFCFFCPVTGDVYRCLRLDFGWSLAPGVFCSLTAELRAILSARLRLLFGDRSLSRYYIDDNCSRFPAGGGPPLPVVERSSAADLLARASSANESRAILMSADTADRANIRYSTSKDQLGPAVVFLGLRIDAQTRVAVVRAAKLDQALTMLHAVRMIVMAPAPVGDLCTTIPRGFMLRTAGNLQWLAQNFRHGRLHTSGVWQATELLSRSAALSVVGRRDLAADASWWAEAASSGRLRSHRFVRGVDVPSLDVVIGAAVPGGAFAATPFPLPHPDGGRPIVAFLGDAAGGTALGGVWRAAGSGALHAFYHLFSEEERAWPSIALKELLAVVLWIEQFGRAYRGHFLLCGTDNFGNVYTVNRLRILAGDAVMAQLLERLIAAADACDIECLLWWCPRALNGFADVLSKCTSPALARRAATRLGAVLHDLGALGPGSS